MEKQIVLWMVTVFLNALFTKHLLVQLLIIYKASVSTTTKYYYGTCENTFKERYNNDNCSFRNKSREKKTKLSKYIWELNKKNINYFINWNITMKSQKYVCGSQKCDLCVFEKLLISRADPNVLLNKRDELVSK